MAKEQQEEKQGVPYGSCAAYGCPLPGAIADSQLGSERWMCNIHFHAHGGNWTEITQRINRRRVDVRLVKALRESLNGKPMEVEPTLKYLQDNNQDALLPGDSERRSDGKLSMRKWLYKVERKLAGEVTLGLSQESTAPMVSPEQIMDRVEQWLKDHRIPGSE